MARRAPLHSGISAVEQLKGFLKSSGESVEIPVSEVHDVDNSIEHACLYLSNFIDRKIKEQGFESLDQANEESPDICEMLFVLSLIEEAGYITERYVNQTLIASN